jgi:DNA-binding response OmpR family regulator
MPSRLELLACCCRDDDIAVLRAAAGPNGPVFRVVDNPMKVARQAVARRPVALILGVGQRSLANLDVIPLIRAVRSDLPVIVIAEEDSLELERRVRQKGIFYYLVHPIEPSEVEAVLADALRCARH